MSNIITDIQSRKGKPCHLCGHLHDIKSKCNGQHLAHMIVRLKEANGMIPSILKANKEAVETAQAFQEIIKDADQAHTILMEVLSMPEYPDGELIRQRYLEELDKWQKQKVAQKSTSPATSDPQLGLFDQENSTPAGTQTKGSTDLESGNNSELSSGKTTPSATPAENPPRP